MADLSNQETKHGNDLKHQNGEGVATEAGHMHDDLFIEEVRGHNRAMKSLLSFTHSSTKAAAVMLLAAIVALIVANSGGYGAFLEFWHTEVSVGVGSFHGEMSLAHIINDICMAVFFLLVGLEIKYEMTVGELTNIRQAALPILGAVGGVLVPIVIYSAFNATNPDTAPGWGVPTATDIAFALGILALLGNRVPSGVRVFLSTLAVADDIIAILVIAIFYGDSPDFMWLGLAAVVFVVLILMNHFHVYSLVPYMLVGIVLWFCVFSSGIHSTIAGVLLAFTIPSGSRVHLSNFLKWSGGSVAKAHSEFDESQPISKQKDYIHTVSTLSDVARQVVPPATRLEHKLYPWVYFVILPLFALTNADVSLIGADIGQVLTSSVTMGVFFGLLLGKPIGIMLLSFLCVKLKIASLPENVNWMHMLGASILGGVGFTMAIFVANLAYVDPVYITEAKFAILLASFAAGVIGFTLLALQARMTEKHGIAYISTRDVSESLPHDYIEAANDSQGLLQAAHIDAIKDDLKIARDEGGIFEIAVDLGPTGLLGGGSITDVRDAIRAEVLRVLEAEGNQDILAKVRDEFERNVDRPPLESVVDTLAREGDNQKVRNALGCDRNTL
jgi:NhaA family Na+:H+ antiporter